MTLHNRAFIESEISRKTPANFDSFKSTFELLLIFIKEISCELDFVEDFRMNIKFFSLHNRYGSKILMRWFEHLPDETRKTVLLQLSDSITIRNRFDSLPIETPYCKVISQVEKDIVFSIGCSSNDNDIEYMAVIKYIIEIIKQLIDGDFTRHQLSVNFLLVLSVIDRVLGSGEINMNNRDEIIEEFRGTEHTKNNSQQSSRKQSNV